MLYMFFFYNSSDHRHPPQLTRSIPPRPTSDLQPPDRVARFLAAAGLKERAARDNPKKAEPGEKAKERAEERAAKLAEAEEAAKEAAAAPAEEAPVAEEAESDATGSVKSEETAEAVADEIGRAHV